MLQDNDFMAIALDLARLGLGRTSPNPAVGAVIVKKGKILATGFHQKAGMPHAEAEAIGKLQSSKLKGATLYLNLEPCCHFGRTPPCTDAILQSGIREVVIGMRDPDSKVSGRGIRILKQQGIRVREGILRKECERLNEAYLKHRRTGLPFVILKVAATLNGRVRPQKGKWITGKEARNYVHILRDSSDAILVGIGTVLKDNPRLTTRIEGGKDPVRVILDSSLRLSSKANVVKVRSNAPTYVATTKPGKKADQLTRAGARILICRKDPQGRVNLKDLLRQLANEGILSLMVEGGPTVLSSFMKAKLADKVFLFLAPRCSPSPSLKEIDLLRKMSRLQNMTVRTLGQDLLVEGNL